MKYAETTTVPVERSRAEIEATLVRYGATDFAYSWSATRATIMFRAHERIVRFHLELPDPNDKCFKRDKRSSYRDVDEATSRTRWERTCRQKWRALSLVIKAKLEAVESKISVFEDEFLAWVVLPNGKTVGEVARPTIAASYASGRVQALLPDFTQGAS